MDTKLLGKILYETGWLSEPEGVRLLADATDAITRNTLGVAIKDAQHGERCAIADVMQREADQTLDFGPRGLLLRWAMALRNGGPSLAGPGGWGRLD